MKKIFNILTAAILLITLLTTPAFASVFDNISIGDLVNGGWLSPDAESNGIECDVKTGTNALVLRRGVGGSDKIAAEYKYTAANGAPYYLELDFSFTAGTVAHIRNNNESTPAGWFYIANNTLYTHNGSSTKVRVLEPNVVHTLAITYSSFEKTCTATIDGEIFELSGAAINSYIPNCLRIILTADNSTLKIHRFQRNLYNNGTKYMFNETFDGKTIADITPATGAATGWTTLKQDENHSAAIENTANVKGLIFKGGESGSIGSRTDNIAHNGQPAGSEWTFLYREGMKVSFRCTNDASWVYAIFIENGSINIQDDATGAYTVLKTGLADGQIYTMKVENNTFADKSLKVYINGIEVASGRGTTTAPNGRSAVKTLHVFNTGSVDFCLLSLKTSAVNYANNIRGLEDYSTTATGANWSSSGTLSIGTVSLSDKYLSIRRVGAGNDYTVKSPALIEDDSYDLKLSYMRACSGQTEILLCNGSIKLLVESGKLKYWNGSSYDVIDNWIEPYAIHTVTAKVNGRTVALYANGEFVVLTQFVDKLIPSVTVNSLKQTIFNGGTAANPLLYSQFMVTDLSAEKFSGNFGDEGLNLIFVDGNGDEIKTIAECPTEAKVCGKALLANAADKNITGCVIMAMYDGEELVKCSISDTVTIPSGQIVAPVNMSITAEKLTKGMKFKLFMFKSDGSLTPVTKNSEISVQ